MDIVTLGAAKKNARKVSGAVDVDAAIAAAAAAEDAQEAAEAAAEDATERSAGAYAQETASGNPAHFTDGAVMPVQALTAQITAVQTGSGTPASDNIRPILGWTGVRITVGAYVLDVKMDGIEQGNVNSSGEMESSSRRVRSKYIPVVPGRKYYLLTNITVFNVVREFTSQAQAGYNNKSHNVAPTAEMPVPTFTASETAAYIRIVLANSSSSNSGATIAPSDVAYCYLVQADSVAQVLFPEGAGTVYGGSLKLNSDGSGTLTKTWAGIAEYAGETLPGEWLSDRDEYAAGTTPTTGAQVAYELAEPVTYELTADASQVVETLLGENYVVADCGSVSLTYCANPQLYVAEQLAQGTALIGLDENGTASRNYAQGELLRSNGKAYKATAAIASGESIVPGTNVTETTIIGVLNEPDSVTDVQMNGTSVVTNGVANVPAASTDNYGVVQIGDGLQIASSKITTNPAGDNDVKAATNRFKPIAPYRQHRATFYGLATAAGADMSSSSNPVGTYTDAAIDKILTMLGVFDLIAPHENAQSSAAYAIGDAFIYNGKLYKATASIAANDTITPGTNCSQTTLIDIIKGA